MEDLEKDMEGSSLKPWDIFVLNSNILTLLDKLYQHNHPLWSPSRKEKEHEIGMTPI
jgi:hypothetical protein